MDLNYVIQLKYVCIPNVILNFRMMYYSLIIKDLVWCTYYYYLQQNKFLNDERLSKD
jgi:hypothetical protein